MFRQEWFPGKPAFVQGNLSWSRPNVVRGLHYHLRQADLWVPIDGEATVGLVDLRPGSPTANEGLTLDVEPSMGLYIPAGVAHGFCARSPYTFLYLVDRYYEAGADEHGFHPLDPSSGISWPTDDPILSARDREAPGLTDALATSPVGPWIG